MLRITQSCDISSVYGIVMLQFLEMVADSITDYGFIALYWGEPASASTTELNLFRVTLKLVSLVDALSEYALNSISRDCLMNVFLQLDSLCNFISYGESSCFPRFTSETRLS
jgi:hypothetical protein